MDLQGRTVNRTKVSFKHPFGANSREGIETILSSQQSTVFTFSHPTVLQEGVVHFFQRGSVWKIIL